MIWNPFCNDAGGQKDKPDGAFISRRVLNIEANTRLQRLPPTLRELCRLALHRYAQSRESGFSFAVVAPTPAAIARAMIGAAVAIAGVSIIVAVIGVVAMMTTPVMVITIPPMAALAAVKMGTTEMA
jgi:hypothetical protein